MIRRSLALALIVVSSAAVVSSAPATHYRSIGSAPDYTTGSISVLNGETQVIGSLSVKWKSANRGRGDRIDIAGTDYTIFTVDAENELTLTTPYSGPDLYAVPYTVSRKFKKLVDWEDCIEANVLPCPGVTTPNLPADQRVEIGVVYKDTPFMMNVGGERLALDALTTSAAFGITLTTNPANRHHGIENTGVILDNSNQSNPAIDIRNMAGYVTIEWIELWRGDAADQIFISNVGSSSQVVVRNVLFRDDDNSANGIRINDDPANLLVYNSVFYGLDRGIQVDGLSPSSPGRFEFFHNTFFQNNVGLSSATGSPNNNAIFMNGDLAISNGTDFNAIFPNPTSGNNRSSDATAVNHFGIPNITPPSVMFVNILAPPFDLHIQRGSIVQDGGFPIAGVTEDLDGRPRGGLPDIGADEAESSSANPVKVLTAKASNQNVVLEWQHPDFGPMSQVDIVRSMVSDPLKPSDGVLACSLATPAPFTKGQCVDTQPLTNGTPYFYSAFVFDTGGNYSKEKSVTGIPFDNVTKPPEWTYQTRASALDPAGVRGASAFLLSNDFFLHAMQGTSGATGGQWPLTGWAPYKLPALVQHRPVIVDVAGNNTALLSAQDGRVYAVDINTGLLVWKSPVLGGSISAAPAALVGAYGATGGGADKVYVGTSDASGNALYILDLMTGARVGQFDDLGQMLNIGAITGVAVTYPSGPVYFTSDTGVGGTPRNVWSVNVAILPSPAVANWSDATPGPVDAGPTLYNGLILVGSRTGSLHAYNNAGTHLWNTVSPGDGPVKAPIFPVWPNDTVVFTTDTFVHSVQIAATGGCGTAPCAPWSLQLGGGAILSPVLVVPGTADAFLGDANGVLHEITLDRAAPMNSPLSTRPFGISTSQLGGPAFSLSQMMLYVSDTSGRVHGVPWPLP